VVWLRVHAGCRAEQQREEAEDRHDEMARLFHRCTVEKSINPTRTVFVCGAFEARWWSLSKNYAGRRSNLVEQATMCDKRRRNTGILHYVQDDDRKTKREERLEFDGQRSKRVIVKLLSAAKE
jgi:hypothetical protein